MFDDEVINEGFGVLRNSMLEQFKVLFSSPDRKNVSF